MGALLSACQQALPGFTWEPLFPHEVTGSQRCLCLVVSTAGADVWEGRLYHHTAAATRRLERFRADTLDTLAAEVRECLSAIAEAATAARGRYPVPKRVVGGA